MAAHSTPTPSATGFPACSAGRSTRRIRTLRALTAAIAGIGFVVPGLALPASAAEAAPDAGAAPVTLSGSYVTSLDDTGNGVDQATVGEGITFTVNAALPAGNPVDGAVIEAVVPVELAVVGEPRASFQSGTTPAGIVASTADGRVRLSVPDGWVVPDGETASLTFDATVQDVEAVHVGVQLELATTFSGRRDGASLTASQSMFVAVVEPQIAVVGMHDEEPGGVLTGSADFSAEISGAHEGSTAYDVVVVAELESAFVPHGEDGGPAQDGEVLESSGGVWDEETRTITFPTIPVLGPYDTVLIQFSGSLVDPLPMGAAFGTVVRAYASSMPGDVPGERTSASAAGDRYIGTSAISLLPPPMWTTTTVTPATARVGDVVTVQIEATLPYHVTAWDTTLRATLPAGLQYVDTVSARCTSSGACIVRPGIPLAPEGQELAWFFGDAALDDEFSVSAVTVVLHAQVIDAPLGGGTVTVGGRLAVNTEDRLDAPTTVGELATFDTVGDVGSDDLVIEAPDVTPVPVTMAARVATSVNEAGNGPADVTVGETATWTVVATLPGGVALDGAELSATVPDTVAIAGPDSGTPPSARLSTGDLPDGTTVSTEGQVVVVRVPDGWTVPEGGVRFALTLSGQIRDVDAVTAGASVEVAAAFSAVGPGGAGAATMTTVAVGVVEPSVLAGNSHDSVYVIASPGGSLQLTAWAGNRPGAAYAYDVVAVTQLPRALTPRGPDGEPSVDGGPVGWGGTGVWDATARTITWPAIDLVPGGDPLERYYQVDVAEDLTPRDSVAVSTTATATSMPGPVVGERTAATAPGPSRYTATAVLPVRLPVGWVSMSADPATAAPGDIVMISATVTLPTDASFDSTLLMQLPEGLEYVSTVSALCNTEPSCAEGDGLVLLAPSGRTAGVFLGDLGEAYSWAPQVTFIIQARVADGATGTLTTTATLAWDEVDRLGRPATVAELGTFDRVSDPGSVAIDVAVAVPALQVSAAVVDATGNPVTGPVAPGSWLTWQVEVTNTGGATAQDVMLLDSTDPRLGRAAAVTGAAVLDGDATGDGTLHLALAAVAPGETATVTYRLRVPTPAPGEQIGTLSSAVELSWSSAPGDVPGEQVGTASASVAVDVGDPGGVLAGRVRIESLLDGRVMGLASGVRVVVRWLGPDRLPGGGDDVRVATRTDATGRWSVGALRPGWYQVRFDGSTLPGLTVPWRDSDGGAPLVTTVHLSTDQVRPRNNLVLAGLTAGSPG